MDNLSSPFIFSKVSSPVSSENEMSLNFSHLISNFIPRFVGTRNIKFHSPLCRNTEYQSYHSPFWRRTECRQSHRPICRMTRRHSISFSSVFPRCVGWRNVKNVIPSVSGPEMSPIKCLFLQTISLPIHFKTSHYQFKILFSFLHIAINTVADNHFP